MSCRCREKDLFSGNLKIAVVDATVLIKGCPFERIADAVVTVQEVLDEVASVAFCLPLRMTLVESRFGIERRGTGCRTLLSKYELLHRPQIPSKQVMKKQRHGR